MSRLVPPGLAKGLLCLALLLTGAARCAADLPPADCVLLLRQARLAEAAGDGEKARELLDSAVEKHPEELLPLVARWQFLRRAGGTAEEVRRLRELIGRHLADLSKPLAIGTIKFLIDELEPEPAVIESLLRHVDERLVPEPEEPDYLELRYVLQLRLNREREARESLRRLRAVSDSEPLRWRAFALDQRLGNWPEVLAFLRQEVSTPDPSQFVRGLYLEALIRQGEFDEASEELAKIAAAETEDASVTFLQILDTAAWAFHDQGRSEEARRTWERLASLSPDDVAARKVLYHLYGAGQEVGVGEELAATEDPSVLLEAGTEYLAAGDPQRALPFLQSAAEQLGDSEAAWFNAGLAAYQLERWEAAARSFERAADLNPERAATRFNLAMALFGLERCGEAVPHFIKSLELEPERHAAHYYLGSCYEALGKAAEAGEQMQLYRAKKPG